MTPDEVFERVVREMTVMFELDPSKLTPQAKLVEDLDLDSIDAIDMAVKMQELTGKRVSEAALRKIRTVGDICNLVTAMMSEKG